MTVSPTTSRVLLVVLLVLIFGVHLGGVGFFMKDEARYVQAAREMRRSGDFLVPTLRGVPRLNKPPLLYWMIAAGQEAFGENEFSGRLPSALCGMLIALLVFTVARQMAGEFAGIFGAVVYATSAFGLGMARLAHPESLLVLGVTGAIVCFYLAFREGFARRRMILCFWLFAGLGFLGKGPHGILLPLLTVATFLLLRWDLGAFRKLMLLRGLLISLLPVAVWGGITLAVSGPETGRMWLDETLGRISGAKNYHPEPAWFFGKILPGGFAPWTLWIPLTIAVFRRKTDAPGGGLFLLVWAAVPFVFFSLGVNKVSAYMLSVMPPLAAATGIALSRLRAGPALRATGWLFATLALGLAVAVAYAPVPDHIEFPPGALILVTMILIALFVFGAATAWANRPRLFAAGSAVGCVLLIVTGICLILPAFGPTHSMKIPGTRIHELIRSEDLLSDTRTERAGLLWYADHEIERKPGVADLLEIWAGERRIFAYGRVRDLSPLMDRVRPRMWVLWSDPEKKYIVITNFDPAS